MKNKKHNKNKNIHNKTVVKTEQKPQSDENVNANKDTIGKKIYLYVLNSLLHK